MANEVILDSEARVAAFADALRRGGWSGYVSWGGRDITDPEPTAKVSVSKGNNRLDAKTGDVCIPVGDLTQVDEEWSVADEYLTYTAAQFQAVQAVFTPPA